MAEAPERTGRLAGLVGRATDSLLGVPRGTTDYEVHRDLASTMPDGAVLLGDLYRPRGEASPQPVVLIRLPYGRAGAFGFLFARTLARHGFTVFIQSTRGTFGSGGQFRPFSTEHDDGLATLAWVREQPWCDGRVAMTGGSYFGHTQWAVAPYADPPLVAFAPHITAREITSPFYEGGVPGALNALSWSSTIFRQERGPLASAPNPLRRSAIREAIGSTPLQKADVAVNGGPEQFWRDFVEHTATDDPFWDHTDHRAAPLDTLPPVSMVTGWWDLFLPGQLADVTALQAAGKPVRILVGPWLHGEPGEMKAIVAHDLAWFDHHLNGAPEPAGPPVRVALQNTDTWLDLEQWPPPAATPFHLHLQPHGGIADQPYAGSAGPGRFTYDPSDPTPHAGGPLLQAPGKQADNRALEARADVLVFTGTPLTAGLDLVGPISARIHLRTSVPHADVFVRVCDVDERGKSLNVVDGIRRLGPDDEAEVDGTRAVDVELYPTAYRVPAGHRLRVQVSGGAFPRYAPSRGTGDPVPSGTASAPCRFEVFADADHPSHVVLSTLA